MTKKELVHKLVSLENEDDNETAHILADEALIEYIDDLEIADAYNKVGKWYS